MKELGLYIHVPFCIQKCNYCDFYSISAGDASIKEYIRRTKECLEMWSEEFRDRTIDTIYFGGGTPSILETQGLLEISECIQKHFNVSQEAEVTAEVNPITTENIDFFSLKSNGFNRISVGMQSTDNNELRMLGRLHGTKEVDRTINAILKGGIDNFSLDVMLGIPLQTPESLTTTLDYCINSGASHISTYMLKIEKGTPFHKMRDHLPFADDDCQADLYEQTANTLKSAGFRHYEISNFCKNDRISRHNMKYWMLEDYLGIGPSAHSMIDNKRFYYPKSLADFRFNNTIYESDAKTKEEFVMLSLRTDKGLEPKKFRELFGTDIPNHLINEAKKLSVYNLIDITPDRIRLTEQGFLLSNTIISRLLSTEI